MPKIDKTAFVKMVQKLGRHFPREPLKMETEPIRVAITGAAG